MAPAVRRVFRSGCPACVLIATTRTRTLLCQHYLRPLSRPQRGIAAPPAAGLRIPGIRINVKAYLLIAADYVTSLYTGKAGMTEATVTGKNVTADKATYQKGETVTLTATDASV